MRIVGVVSLVLVGISLSACDESNNKDDDPDSGTDTATDSETPCCPAASTINCGHRGTGIHTQENPFPENTIPSFLQAESEGAQMVELDVHHSKDGAVVVIHDALLETTTNGTGCVGDTTLADLQKLDAAVGTPEEGKGITIPTLQEALDAISVDVNIEIKVTQGTDCPDTDVTQLVSDVISLIKADQKDRNIIISSFSLDAAKEAKKIDASIYVGYISLLATMANTAQQSGLDAFHVKGSALNAENLATVKATGLDINVWTINSPEEIEFFLKAGVHMIITDEPQTVETIRSQVCDTLCAD